MNVIVFFRKGHEKPYASKRFQDALSVEAENGVLIVTDEYGARMMYPLDTVDRVEQEAPPRYS